MYLVPNTDHAAWTLVLPHIPITGGTQDQVLERVRTIRDFIEATRRDDLVVKVTPQPGVASAEGVRARLPDIHVFLQTKLDAVQPRSTPQEASTTSGTEGINALIRVVSEDPQTAWRLETQLGSTGTEFNRTVLTEIPTGVDSPTTFYLKSPQTMTHTAWEAINKFLAVLETHPHITANEVGFADEHGTRQLLPSVYTWLKARNSTEPPRPRRRQVPDSDPTESESEDPAGSKRHKQQ